MPVQPSPASRALRRAALIEELKASYWQDASLRLRLIEALSETAPSVEPASRSALVKKLEKAIHDSAPFVTPDPVEALNTLYTAAREAIEALQADAALVAEIDKALIDEEVERMTDDGYDAELSRQAKQRCIDLLKKCRTRFSPGDTERITP